MPPNPGYKITRDGGLILHPSLASATDSVKIPSTDTAAGAGFGSTINDTDLAFAACREPIAIFLTYGVANDITDKWFVVNDPDTEEADPALDRGIQSVLSKLMFKKHLTEAITQARIYRKSLIVCAFNDAKTVDQLRKPLAKGAELMQFATYPKTVDEQKTNDYTVDVKDENLNSLRYGEPVIYKIDRGNGNYLYVHYTRVIELDNTQGVLNGVWDDIVCGRNIRWGFAQMVYRIGSGFAVIGFPQGTTVEQLEAWSQSNAFSNLMNRTYIVIAQNSTQENTGMTFDFKGAAGVVIDPIPYFKSNIEQHAIATGIPQAKLVGAQAGAVTGSEVNMQDYYKMVSREQSKFEYVVRWVIDRLAESGQVKLIKTATDQNIVKKLIKKATDYRHRTAEQYVVEWNSAFELSEKDESQIAFTHAQTQEKKLGWMSKDEIRAEEGLEPLPDGAGEWKDAPDFGGEQFLVQSKPGLKPNAKPNEKPKDNPSSPSSPSGN